MPHSLFSVYGVEIEYALVRRRGGAAAPLAAEALTALGGSPDSHPAFGAVEFDNELAAHVLELKAGRPATALLPLLADFRAAVAGANAALAPMDAALLPGGMHPFMNPARESQLWDHDDSPIYAAYDRIFDCRGHGWFNVQSAHLNLPFAGDAEFSRLHNAVSLLLPLLPALSAASPIWDGRPGPWLDGRLFHYAINQKRFAEITGPLVPEPVNGEQEYRDRILAPMYAAIAPEDPEGILQDEWLNSRAAIARFDRSAIEIRCLDTQLNPVEDLAICHFAACALKFLLARARDLYRVHAGLPAGLLRELFLETARLGRAARVPSGYPAGLFVGGGAREGMDAGALLRTALPEIYRHSAPEEESAFRPVLEGFLAEGNNAERMLRRWQADPDPAGYCDWLRGRLEAV